MKTHTQEFFEFRENSNQANASHGVMEGNGAYNKYAQSQADGAAVAFPLLQSAVKNIPLEPGHQPTIIADYGSSQGKNSLAPIGMAIRNVRARVGPNHPVCVFHIDQRSNDFNSLFEVLSCDPDRYASDQSNVFPCAIGRSFYEQVLPPESVHLGWSSHAAVWLRRVPALIPDHFWSARSTGAARAAFERQAAEDWEMFLSLRAREMRRGARLVVVLPALYDARSSGLGDLMDDANELLQQMVEEGSITGEERAGMVLGAYLRSKSELLLPFAKQGHFQHLVVESYGESVVPDVAWVEYKESGDKQSLARKRALFFRSTFMPSLAEGVGRVGEGDREARRAFAERLENGLTQRLVCHPVPVDMLAQTVVLEKCI